MTQFGTAISNFGIPIFVMREISKHNLELRNSNDVLHKFWTAIPTILINSILLVLLINILFWLGLYKSDFNIASPMLIMSLSIPFMALNMLNAQVLRANLKLKTFQFLIGVCNFLIFIVILTALFLSRMEVSLTLVSASYLFAAIFTYVLSLFMLARSKIKLKFILRLQYILRNLKDGYSFFISLLGSQAFNWISILLVSLHCADINSVGALGVIYRVTSLTTIVLMVVNNIGGPQYSNLFFNNDIHSLNKAVKKNNKIMLVLTLPLIAILFVFAGNVLSFFEVKSLMYIFPFRIVLLAYTFNLLFGSSGLLMQMSGAEKIFKYVLLITLAIHFLLGRILVINYEFNGVAFMILVSFIIWNVISAIYLYRKNRIKVVGI